MPFSQLVKFFRRVIVKYSKIWSEGGVKSEHFWTGKEKLNLTSYKIIIVNK